MSDHARCDSEVLPRLTAEGSRVTRPLISLIVPVWNDDELVDDRRASIVLWEGLARRINSFAGPLFGDQSIFARASVFERLGGFADIPLMEDIEFSRRLRRLGYNLLLDPPLWSSPRRFRRLGNWRATLVNVTFIGLFYLGVDPYALHSWYYRSFRGSSGQDIGVDTLSQSARGE